MYDTVSSSATGLTTLHNRRSRQVKGSDWLGDQDAIHYMCREAPNTVIEVRLARFIYVEWAHNSGAA